LWFIACTNILVTSRNVTRPTPVAHYISPSSLKDFYVGRVPYRSVLHVNVGSSVVSLFSKILPVFRAMIYVIHLSTNQEEVPFRAGMYWCGAEEYNFRLPPKCK